MDSILYTINKATVTDIELHLNKCSIYFVPPLDSYIDIPSYSFKLQTYSETFEAWYNDELISLIACYLNDHDSKIGFISNVSTVKAYQGFGIAKKMIHDLFEHAIHKGFTSLTLEVNKDNRNAIGFYENLGFIKDYLKNDFQVMEKYLNK